MGRLGPSWNVDPCFVTDDLIPAHPGINIGSTTQRFANFYVDNLFANATLPLGDNADDLGALTDRYRNLYLGSQLRLANGQGGAVSARNQGNTAYQDMLWLDATNDTVLNAATGELIKLSVNAAQIASVSASLISSSVNLTFTNAASVITGGATSLTLSSGNTVILRTSDDPQRILTFGGPSDTSMILKWGDGGTTATQTLTIASGNPDGDDDSTLKLGGGGDSVIAQGAIGQFYGNETTSAGALILQSGNNASGDIVFGTTGTNGKIRVETGAAIPAFNVNSTGSIVFQAATMGIQLQSGANGRTGTFTINGATPVVISNTSLAAGDMIILARDTIGGTPLYFDLTSRTNGTGFSITGTATDTSTGRYWLVRVN